MSVIGTFGDLGGVGGLGGLGGGNPVGGLVSGAAGSAADYVLQRISSWVLDGTRGALEQVASAIGSATAPNLNSTWFSSTYWRVAALAALLTIPFLCAAAVQAVARADLALLARVAFGYLPLSVLAVSLAAPLTMLMLAATDQMSAAVSASAATGGARFLDHAAEVAGTLASAAGGSPFFAVVVGLLAVMAALALAVELLIRAAAVYVVVLMLPLAFAAMVWPARRVWTVRLVELLASLILSKFVIVAVLSLAAAAFAGSTPGIGELLVAMSLILLSTFAPWALMRILPFTELAAGAAGIMRGELPLPHAGTGVSAVQRAADAGGIADGIAVDLPARLRNQARSMYAASGAEGRSERGTSEAPPTAPRPVERQAPVPSTNGAPVASASGTSAPSSGASPMLGSGPDPDDDRPPYVPPDAWRSDQPVRLDEHLLRRADPASPASNPPEQP